MQLQRGPCRVWRRSCWFLSFSLFTSISSSSLFHINRFLSLKGMSWRTERERQTHRHESYVLKAFRHCRAFAIFDLKKRRYKKGRPFVKTKLVSLTYFLFAHKAMGDIITPPPLSPPPTPPSHPSPPLLFPQSPFFSRFLSSTTTPLPPHPTHTQLGATKHPPTQIAKQ